MNNSDLLQLVGEQNNSQLVRDLGVSSPLLKVIHQNFTRIFENIPGCCVISFYEALDSNTIKEVQNGTWKSTDEPLRFVTMESATYAVPNKQFHNQIALDSDHSNMVKYDHVSDDRFIIVSTKLKKCVQKLRNGSSSGV
ncbi:hypothetical protein FPQ18DRAFT_87903 [Pyronema domesticum]|nr:hypothetical protein FPQ18DRAFT_87903 [Pyronema domesticum]